MGLYIDSISCTDFRSYEQFSLKDIGNLTLIVGPNAIGKTNLIEGIQLTTAFSSFRHPRADHLVREGAQAASFQSVLKGDGRLLKVKLLSTSEGRSFYLNDKKKRAHTLRGILPSVLFCPDDLDLIKGSQSTKRAQLDFLGTQLSSGYSAVRRDYEKILRQKNSYLKQEARHDYLVSINEVVASVGSQLYRMRAHIIESLLPYIQEYYAQLSSGKERIDVSYVPSWDRKTYDLERYHEIVQVEREEACRILYEVMERDHQKEHERHMSLYGPQVDRIEFYLNGRNASTFASQGQQRSLVLSYKMAEVALIKDKLGQDPVLLLDDVMSELDSDRRAALLSLLSEGIQTFITATNAESFDEKLLQKARLIELA